MWYGHNENLATELENDACVKSACDAGNSFLGYLPETLGHT